MQLNLVDSELKWKIPCKMGFCTIDKDLADNS